MHIYLYVCMYTQTLFKLCYKSNGHIKFCTFAIGDNQGYKICSYLISILCSCWKNAFPAISVYWNFPEIAMGALQNLLFMTVYLFETDFFPCIKRNKQDPKPMKHLEFSW